MAQPNKIWGWGVLKYAEDPFVLKHKFVVKSGVAIKLQIQALIAG